MNNHFNEETENNEILVIENQPVINHVNNNRNQSRKGRVWVSSIASGIIGSLLTVSILTFTNIDLPGEQKQQEAVQQSPLVDTSVQKVSASSTNIADMVENASKAIVGIENLQVRNDYFSSSTEPVKSGTGSGVIFKVEGDDAYIVTNHHVIENANELEVSLYNGEKTTAKLIGTDPLTDLAVLKISAEHVTTVLSFGDSSNIRPGEQVLAIGNPLGLNLSRTVTQGIISAADRTIPVQTSAGEWELSVIQTDAAINPGNSGGALINTQGQVIGINSLKISENGVEGLGFAIPSNDVLPIVNELIKNGHIERPYIGVNLEDIENIPLQFLTGLPKQVTEGTMVTTIDPNSAAAKAGLEIQDVIVAINGSKVKNASDLRKYLYTKLHAGDKVTLDVYRDKKLLEIDLTLTSKK